MRTPACPRAAKAAVPSSARVGIVQPLAKGAARLSRPGAKGLYRADLCGCAERRGGGRWRPLVCRGNFPCQRALRVLMGGAGITLVPGGTMGVMQYRVSDRKGSLRNPRRFDACASLVAAVLALAALPAWAQDAASQSSVAQSPVT